MTIGIKTSTRDVYLFDAVSRFSETSSGSLSSHPIEGGLSIVDHVINENRTYTLTGLFSEDGFTPTMETYSAISSLEANGIELFNILYRKVDEPVQVDYNQPSNLSKIIPEGLSNFVQAPTPTVELSSVDRRNLEELRQIFFDVKESSTTVDLVLFNDKGLVDRLIKGCVITNLSIEETPDTTGVLEITMSLEQPIIALLKSTVVESLTWKEIRQGVSSKSKKGKQDIVDSSNTSLPKPPTPEGADDFNTCRQQYTSLVCWSGVAR